ncbi:hypothetical protein G6O69_12615 [Pseudenhygromyxa sp. WMMC2535]|uniref:3-oxoacyl-ACP synthase III family protein n=1 Tax=Pseudenhygromyxa sp. WMMC2535 TaxID=2712867 RepID=UPI0015563BD0|nr:3-oxoacyl-[acyl-carrier-protein] synthase III C-terminal domain-containing protein [Pseudenhygromyxa sp. WMMC2535]NVB38676.1 hypothetical protein [Pseudenhygromyxa sp. WMMC2535]
MIGILGIGAFLPDNIRTNSWWPESVVDGWRARLKRIERPEPEDPLEHLIWAAQEGLSNDPFGGSIERRIMPEGMNALDMEIAASREVLARCSMPASEIDLILVQSTIPDYLSTNTACTIHAALGLPAHALAMSVECACNGFNQQVIFAEAMIAAGRARTALLVQSCSLSRVVPPDTPHSPWFGDGATAVLLGEVEAGRELLSFSNRTDGTIGNTLVTGVPDRRWWEEGRSIFYNTDSGNSRRMLAGVPAGARATMLGAIEKAGLEPGDADFIATHQAFPWYRRVAQTAAGLEHCRGFDTFTQVASMSSANVPFVLYAAAKEGVLREGDVVVTQAGGSGITFSSLALRWGGRV